MFELYKNDTISLTLMFDLTPTLADSLCKAIGRKINFLEDCIIG